MPWNSATIRIRNNNQAPSGPVAFRNDFLTQILNGGPCKKSVMAYELLAAGLQNNRVHNWNKRKYGDYYYGERC